MKLKWEEGGLCGGENEDIGKKNMRIKLKLKIPSNSRFLPIKFIVMTTYTYSMEFILRKLYTTNYADILNSIKKVNKK